MKQDVVHHYKHYKLHMFVDDNQEGCYRICEYIGDLGRFSNSMELDVETPFRVPGEKEGKKCKSSLADSDSRHL